MYPEHMLCNPQSRLSIRLQLLLIHQMSMSYWYMKSLFRLQNKFRRRMLYSRLSQLWRYLKD